MGKSSWIMCYIWSVCWKWDISVCQEYKIPGRVVPVHTMKAFRRSRGMASLLLTLQLGVCEWSPSLSGCLTSVERTPGTHWIGGWLDTGFLAQRKSLDLAGNWTLYHSACSLLLMELHWLPLHQGCWKEKLQVVMLWLHCLEISTFKWTLAG
jgi:hypothetical protein